MRPSEAFAKLGLLEDAAPDEIRKRYRELCMVHHPDRGGNAVAFDEVRQAYNVAHEQARAPKNCVRCMGRKTVQYVKGWTTTEMTCPRCGGTGFEE